MTYYINYLYIIVFVEDLNVKIMLEYKPLLTVIIRYIRILLIKHLVDSSFIIL